MSEFPPHNLESDDQLMIPFDQRRAEEELELLRRSEMYDPSLSPLALVHEARAFYRRTLQVVSRSSPLAEASEEALRDLAQLESYLLQHGGDKDIPPSEVA